MIRRLIIPAVVLCFILISVNCQKGASPLASQVTGNQQVETASAGGKAQTGSNNAAADIRKSPENRPGTHRNPGVRADRGAPSRAQALGQDIESEAAVLTRSDFMLGREENRLDSALSQPPATINKGSDDENLADDLQVWIRPRKWNVAWEKSEGLVAARFKGTGFTEIAAETLRLVGPEGDTTNAPVRIHLGEFSLRVKFLKSEAIAIIPDPKRGDTYEIKISGQYLGGSQIENLADTVFILGRKPEEQNLSMKVSPKNWNLAWLRKSDEEAGMITVQIKGKGFDDIVVGSVILQGPDQGIGITTAATELTDNSLMVKFLQNKAVGLIPDPQPKTSYPIFIRGGFTGGDTFELSENITVKGKIKNLE